MNRESAVSSPNSGALGAQAKAASKGGLKGAQTVDRALRVLLSYTDAPAEQGATEIAARLGLNKTTVMRLLLTLADHGLLTKSSATHRYRLGPRLMELAGALMKENDLSSMAHDEMALLRDMTQETVSLLVPAEYDRFCILQVESRQDLKRTVKVGQRIPLWTGASGKVLVAFSSPQFQVEVIGKMKDCGEADEARVAAYQSALAEARERFFAISLDERGQGISAVAAPVFNHWGEVIAALSVGGPISRMPEPLLLEWGPKVAVVAKRITQMGLIQG